GEIPSAAAEIGDRERRHQQTDRARPRGPAAAGDELPRIARIGTGVRIEVLLAETQHLLQPRLVSAHGRVVAGLGELRAQHRRERVLAPLPEPGGEPVIAESAVALLRDQTGLLEQTEMPRDAGLRQAED